MTVMMLVKSRKPTPIMSHDDNSCEFSLQIRSLDGELGVGSTNVNDIVAVLMSIDDVNVDNSLISLIDDNDTSLNNTEKEMNQF